MSTFPTSRPAYTGFTPGHSLLVDTHASQHNLEQADIGALSDKVGLGASTPTANTVLRGNGVGTSSFSQVQLASDVAGQLPAANASPVLQAIYPVGCIYIETTGVNPNTTFGFGTWAAYGQGQTLIGVGTSDQLFTAGSTGGESNHTLTSNEMPSHTHTITDPGHLHTTPQVRSGITYTGGGVSNSIDSSLGSTGTSTGTNTTGITNQSTGGGASHNNLPPYIVTYFWRRTA